MDIEILDARDVVMGRASLPMVASAWHVSGGVAELARPIEIKARIGSTPYGLRLVGEELPRPLSGRLHGVASAAAGDVVVVNSLRISLLGIPIDELPECWRPGRLGFV